MSDESAVSVSDVPDEVLELIFAVLPAADVARRCSLVCHAWHALCLSETLWRALTVRDVASDIDEDEARALSESYAYSDAAAAAAASSSSATSSMSSTCTWKTAYRMLTGTLFTKRGMLVQHLEPADSDQSAGKQRTRKYIASAGERRQLVLRERGTLVQRTDEVSDADDKDVQEAMRDRPRLIVMRNENSSYVRGFSDRTLRSGVYFYEIENLHMASGNTMCGVCADEETTAKDPHPGTITKGAVICFGTGEVWRGGSYTGSSVHGCRAGERIGTLIDLRAGHTPCVGWVVNGEYTGPCAALASNVKAWRAMFGMYNQNDCMAIFQQPRSVGIQAFLRENDQYFEMHPPSQFRSESVRVNSSTRQRSGSQSS